MPQFDLYRELEVDPTASPETIEAAWRSLVKRYHPDAVGDSATIRERIRRINVAHDWLADPARRASYDRYRRIHPQPAPSNGEAPGPYGQPPPGMSGNARTSAATPSWVIVVPVVVVAAVAVGLLILLLRTPEEVPASTAPVLSPAPSPASSAPSPAFDAQAEADSLHGILPSRVNELRLRGEAATGESLEDEGGAGSAADFLLALGRDPVDLAFAYKAAPATSGKLLTISAFRARDTKPTTLATAFVKHTKDEQPALRWTQKRSGGQRVWVSADVNEPTISAYVWPGKNEMFLLISDEPALADAGIRATTARSAG